MGFGDRRRLPALVGLIVAFSVVGVVSAPVSASAAPLAAAAAAAALPTSSSVVSADALPTVQIDGVVWSQAVANNLVYVGGSFANTRPAGAAPRTNLTPRSNMLAYDIRTGVLNSTFKPNPNAKVQAVAVSPDGRRVYIGGDFTVSSGVTRNRIAAYDAATGALVSTFAPSVNSTVKAIAATNSTVYVGGGFNTANGVPRNRVAAFSATNGSLLSWNPNANGQVTALVVAPGGSKVIIGGSFSTVGIRPNYGMAAVSATTAAVQTWNVNTVVKDAGDNAAITSLTTNGASIFGTGYVFGAGGNFEGTFAVDPANGDIKWLADCHGDTYSAFPLGSAIYTVSHSHHCNNVNSGFPQTNPQENHRATAFTIAATGTLTPNYLGNYANFAGKPSPSQLNWFPDLTIGTYTGKSQAAWSITGNSQYLSVGGEFPSVNRTAQQGLVRFMIRNGTAAAPNRRGPQVTGGAMTLKAVALTGGQIRVGLQANWDPDDTQLTYQLFRDNATTAVATKTVDSRWWNRPYIALTDTAAPAGTHSYKVRVTDPTGNSQTSSNVAVAVTSARTVTPYVTNVRNAGASIYWRLGESGTTAFDWASGADTSVGTGVSRGATGAVAGNSASTFNGTAAGTMIAPAASFGPQAFTVQAWVKTTSTTGGQVIDFGSAQSGGSVFHDRSLYLSSTGQAYFLVNNGSYQTIHSAAGLNNGLWHQLTGTLDSTGMRLYVDGAQVASSTVRSAWYQYGWWRVGGDNISGYPAGINKTNFVGSLDEIAIYPKALTSAQVSTIYNSRNGAAADAPAAAGDAPADTATAEGTP